MRETTIRENRTLAGRFRGGKLAPVMAVALKAGEGGMLSQSAIIELDPIAGRLISPVTAQMMSVFVPVQAMHALLFTSDPNAGITEVIRQKGMTGATIFDLVDEDDVTKRMGVMPVSIGGVKKVCAAAKLAHICAVNFLRKSVYTYAATLAYPVTTITNALLSSTVLSRFNAVLDPDDHVNGMVGFDINAKIPVKGIGVANPLSNVGSNMDMVETGSATPRSVRGTESATEVVPGLGTNKFVMEFQSTANIPAIYAEAADGSMTGSMSLVDLYNAETMDRLTRQMRAMIEADPVDGEEKVLRWAYGLEIDDLQNPFFLSSQEVIFGQDLKVATDKLGIDAETTQSRLVQELRFTVPVPRTELGGVVVTFLCVKPDEVLFEQPHPVLARPWVFDNLMAEELMLDPVAITGRDLQAGVSVGSETSVVFYTGYNELRRTYVNYGWNRAVDPQTVDAKNAMWLYEIPASVTPENIIYPDDLPHYPFIDQDAEVARYLVSSTFLGRSPIFIGPSPVETVGVIEGDDLFGSADE